MRPGGFAQFLGCRRSKRAASSPDHHRTAREAEQRLAARAASMNDGLTPRNDSLIALVMARFGMSREETIET
jgi:hypothetical protein